MRDTFEWIDRASDKDQNLRQALRDLAAQTIASQALPIAIAKFGNEMTRLQAARLIEDVAGYPGVTSRTMREDSETRVGARATEILIKLLRMKPNFSVRD